MTSGSGTGSVPENPAPTAAATPAPAPAPAPVIPPPAVVTTPANLTDSSPKDQSDRDAMEAYKLLTAGKPADASKLVAKIAKRDPKNENLSELREQIQKYIEAEKQRAKAAASAAAAAAPANASASGRPPAVAPAPGSPGPNPAATDKPTAPPVTSDPVPAAPPASAAQPEPRLRRRSPPSAGREVKP